MKIVCFMLLCTVVLLAAPGVPAAGNPVKVEVLYMDHGPMQPTLRKLRALFPRYGEQLAVSWYDFESEKGAQFKARKKIDYHIPLMIWVNDSVQAALNQRTIALKGFPTGAGPSFFQGKWTIEELEQILDKITKGQ